MGIINSKGEYLMNLDPDDKLESKKNLEILYHKAKKSNLDYILFLLKRIPRNNLEDEECNLRNKNQLLIEDFLITNKFIKKEIFLRAYNFFYKEIYTYKWNFHEDNIWNILVRKFSKKSEILNKYIYIYKRNEKSLNFQVGNLLEIKNRIYRLKTLIKINENNNINNSDLYYYMHYIYHKSIIKSCNSSIFKDKEIKKKIIDISIKFLNIFNNNKEILNYINNKILNKISDNKIIFFFNSFNKNIFDNLIYLIFYKFLQDYDYRKIICIDINNIIQINSIINYIYSNDILFGLNDIMFHSNFLNVINNFNKNKIIILYKNIYSTTISNNITINNSCNYIIYSSNQSHNDKISNKLYSLSVNIIIYANYFNHIKNSKNNNYIPILFENYNKTKILFIKNIFSKYYSNEIVFIPITNINNKKNLKRIIKKSKIILTDNIHLMELSILHFTSCILYGNFTNNKYLNSLFFYLKYIKYISDINELENNIIDLKNISNIYDFELNFKNLNKIMNIFK